MSDLIPRHLSWLRAGGRSRNTIRSRERLLRHAEQELPYGLDDASTDEWADYLSEPTWSQWTRHTYYNHGNGYYTWAVAAGHLTLNPMSGLLRPPEGDRVPNPVSDEELAYALTALPQQPWGMAIRLASLAGLRVCELVTVRREDCIPRLLRVRGKGGRLATVPMHPELWEAIEPMPPGLLVTTIRGKALTASELSHRQRAVFDNVGLRDVHMHRFRHWCGTQVQRSQGDLRVTQQIMRHASSRSTEGYTAVSDRSLHAAIGSVALPSTLGHEPVTTRLVLLPV